MQVKKKAYPPIEVGSKWLNKKMDMEAVVEKVSQHHVVFLFDLCSCVLTKAEFRRRYMAA